MAFTQIVCILWSCFASPLLSLFPMYEDQDIARIYHSSQGRFILFFTCASNVLCTMYITMCVAYGKWPGYLPDTDINLGLICSICCMPFSTNQLGLNERIMWVLSVITFLCYLVYIYFRVSYDRAVTTPYEICATVLAFAILLFDEACRESDLKELYDTLSSANHREMLHVEVPTSRGFSASGNIAYTLNTVVESLKTLTELMDDSTEVVRLPNRSKNHTGHGQKDNVGHRWMKSSAHIFEARMLCLSIILASIPGDNISSLMSDILREKSFKSSHFCMRLFSALETSRGHAMPLFSGESSTDVLITAAHGFCEIMLYLLIHDAVGDKLLGQDPIKGICWVRCIIINGAWAITVSTTQVEDESLPFIQETTQVSSEQKALIKDDRILSKQGTKQTKGSPLIFLAQSLTESYLATQLEMSEFVDQANGIVISHKMFRIPGIVSTILKEDTDSLYPVVKTSWLILDFHVSARDVRVCEQLIFSLRSLTIPYETCSSVYDLHNYKQQHAVVVISETALSAKHLDVSLDLMRLSGGSLLVICDRTSPSFFKDRYGLDVALCIGTSVKRIFHSLQAIYDPQKPRLLRDRKLCSALAE